VDAVSADENVPGKGAAVGRFHPHAVLGFLGLDHLLVDEHLGLVLDVVVQGAENGDPLEEDVDVPHAIQPVSSAAVGPYHHHYTCRFIEWGLVCLKSMTRFPFT
jgi:hypothetical protein